MKKKVMYLSGFVLLLFVGILGSDLTLKKDQPFVLETIITPAEAIGCGIGNFNHHEGFTNGTVCYGGSGDPTDYIILPYNDCRMMPDECCAFPADAPQCPSLGG